MTGRKTPRHHTGHTEPIRTPALRHSIDGNHPELREGQEDSALTADMDGYQGLPTSHAIRAYLEVLYRV
jgi:hypothetical protein